jgi:hypothetical protein
MPSDAVLDILDVPLSVATLTMTQGHVPFRYEG